jgi:hypothetical protein
VGKERVRGGGEGGFERKLKKRIGEASQAGR